MRQAGAGLRAAVIGLPCLWLGLFFLAPFLIVLGISFAAPRIAQPPYAPLLARDADGALSLHLEGEHYRRLASDTLYVEALADSITVAALATLVCLLVAYPMAYAMARAPRAWRPALLMAVMLPFWTSFLLRVYAWMGLLNQHGVLNQLLQALGLIDTPLVLLRTPLALYVGIVYAYLPFMILPLYATLEQLDPGLLEAAADLGCRPLRAFLAVTLPLSLPGVIAGCTLVFIPALGEFVIPDLLGGPDTLMLGKVLWDEFFTNRAWPMAAAIAVALLALALAGMAVQRRLTRRLLPA